MKRDGKKIAGVVAWDTPMARIADRAGVDLVSVGDSVGVNLWGHDDPLQVTMDEMLIVCKAVRRGVDPRAGELRPALRPGAGKPRRGVARRACGWCKEGGADMVKVDAAAEFPDAVRALVRAGIPVFAQFGLTPQTAQQARHSLQRAEFAGGAGHRRGRGQPGRGGQDAGGRRRVRCSTSPTPGRWRARPWSKAVTIPVIGGFGGGPWLDGRVRLAHTAIGYADKWLDSKTDTYVNTAKAALGAFTRADRRHPRRPADQGLSHRCHSGEQPTNR